MRPDLSIPALLNPGPVQFLIAIPDTHFPELPSKTVPLLHTFPENVSIAGFTPNRAF